MANDSEILSLGSKLKFRVIGDYKKIVKEDAPFADNFLALLHAESTARDQEYMKRRIKAAGFPVIKTLDTFEFSKKRLPHLKKDEVEQLSLCGFIKDRANVCALGNSGTGKTHLMTAIGLHALQLGYSVRFYRASDLVVQLAEAESEKHLGSMQKSLQKYNLICLDELGFISMNPASAQLLFNVLAGRYETGSIFVTSNLEFSRWGEFLGDTTMTSALIERLVHRSTILNMNGESYRVPVGRK